MRVEILDLAKSDRVALDAHLGEMPSLYEMRWLRPSTVFQQPSMIIACAEKARQSGHKPVIALVRHGGQIETMWPLKIKRQLGVAIATDLASPITQYSDVIGKPLAAEALADLGAQLRAAYAIDALQTRNVRGDSGLMPAFAERPGSIVARSDAPYIDLAGYRDFAEYSTRFGKNTTRNRRQRRNNLQRLHGYIDFRVLRGAEAQPALRTALEWKRMWLKQNGLFSRVFDRGVNESALINSAAHPSVCLSVLSVAGRPAAIEMGLIAGDHYAAYLGAFDAKFAEFSVGQEQMLRTIEWCMQQGLQRYDLLPPSADYKMQWVRGQTPDPVVDHCLALSAAGRAYALLQRHGKTNARRALAAIPRSLRRFMT
ncbi:MAG TPA: GNAT family N-acetyltransferase [Xanthobacteraceae bacterium]|nr:GNAT family N-acetyltransferase [Xanthobacteraceae bacterium]